MLSDVFVRRSDGSEYFFEDFDAQDAWEADPIQGEVLVRLCHDCAVELEDGQDDYCTVCGGDRAAMYGR